MDIVAQHLLFHPLYLAGDSVYEIASATGEHVDDVIAWHTRHKLPAHRKPSLRPSQPYTQQFAALHAEGFAAWEIARTTGRPTAHVHRWLKYHQKDDHVKAKPLPADDALTLRLAALHQEGQTDAQIVAAVAAEFSEPITLARVKRWRLGRNLPANAPPSKADLLYLPHYRAGLTDTEIARTVGRNPSTICLWRKARNLPPNYTSNRATGKEPIVLSEYTHRKETMARRVTSL